MNGDEKLALARNQRKISIVKMKAGNVISWQ